MSVMSIYRLPTRSFRNEHWNCTRVGIVSHGKTVNVGYFTNPKKKKHCLFLVVVMLCQQWLEQIPNKALIWPTCKSGQVSRLEQRFIVVHHDKIWKGYWIGSFLLFLFLFNVVPFLLLWLTTSIVWADEIPPLKCCWSSPAVQKWFFFRTVLVFWPSSTR